MAIRYKKKKITLCFDKENKVEKYVAANVLVGSINYNKLCDEVNQPGQAFIGLWWMWY